MSDGWGELLMKSPYASKSKGRRVRMEVGRDGWCKTENRNFSWQEEKLSLETLTDSPTRGSHQAEAEEP